MSIEGHRRYLAALLAAVSRDPGLHANQLAAIDRERELATRAADVAGYARLGGAPFELARGMYLDRVVGNARIAALLDDPWTVSACEVELAAAVRGTTVEAWTAEVVAAAAQAWPIRARAADAFALFEHLAVGIVRWAGEHRPAEREDARRDVEGAATALAAIDPVLDLEEPRYRHRLPWSAEGSVALRRLVAPFLRQDGPAQELPDGRGALARIESIAERWRRELRVAHRQLEIPDGDATEIAAAIERGDDVEVARAPVIAQCEALLVRDRAWPEPLRAHHARSLASALRAARTPTEVELVTAHATACLAIESTWLHALVATLGWPLRDALISVNEPGPAMTASLASARETSLALCGESDPWRVPWFADFIERHHVPHATASVEGLGAELCEAGFELLGPWRAWTGIALATGRHASTSDARALCVTEEARRPERSRVRLWDREVALDDVDQLRTDPARPPLPGRSEGSRP